MKNSEIKALSVEELKSNLSSSEAQLADLKFSHAVSPIENPTQITKLRKLVARLKTELHARTLTQVDAKVKDGSLNQFTARQVLKEEKFPTPMNLAKMKKAIAKG